MRWATVSSRGATLTPIAGTPRPSPGSSFSAPLICSTMNGHVSWHSEWMKVSTTTLPRSRARVTRRPFWSVSEKLAARRPAGSRAPSNGERAAAFAGPLPSNRWVRARRRGSPRSPPAGRRGPPSAPAGVWRSASIPLDSGTWRACPPPVRWGKLLTQCMRQRRWPPSCGQSSRRAGAGGDRRRAARALRAGRATRARLRERRAADRLRPDDLPADRRGPDARAARARPERPVLDVGTGSGYHAALLARWPARCGRSSAMPSSAQAARTRCASSATRNVTCLVGDGWEGLPELGPFDAINVAAAAATLPDALLEQLRPGGRLVAPVGDAEQHLMRSRRRRRARRGASRSSRSGSCRWCGREPR